ncbi:MAG: ABC transporter substrate-binding protein [Lachnospiraceae bacterium]|nr:ABC transporter substrate-binding protein [Lachnospiraceae bacterium]
MKRFVSLMACVLLVFSLAACSSPSESQGSGSDAGGDNGITGNLVLYTSEPQDLVSEMIADFEDKYPGVHVDLYRSGTGDVKTKLTTELEAGGTDACIVWFADLGYMYDLDDQGLILHYSPASVANVPDDYKYNDGMGHEVRAIYSVLAYNTTKISTPPADWNDVTTADYTGSLALANPSYSGGAMTTLAVHIQNESQVGWNWYQALADNDVKMEQSNGTLLTKVSSGEYNGVVVVDYLPRNAKNDGSPVDYVYPASGSVLIPTPICLLSSMPEESVEAAKAFVDYMYEIETQKLFVEQGYVPIISEAAEGSDVPTIDDIKVLPMDVEYMRTNSSDLLAKFSEMFGTQ